MSKKIKIEIKSWTTGSVLFTYESVYNTMAKTVTEAVKSDADLRYANLRYANLRGADLRYANLGNANLSGAYLRNADLSNTKLGNANLLNAKNVPDYYAEVCSKDILYVMNYMKDEVPALKQLLIEGKVNGEKYVGDCACLIGSLCKIAGKEKPEQNIGDIVPFYEAGLHNLGEAWFLGITEGDTPENNYRARQAVELCASIIENRMPRIMPQIGDETEVVEEKVTIQISKASLQALKDSGIEVIDE